VDMVSWNDAHSFIQKLNATEKTDRYRLPTEAEWEYAARGGTTTEYFWGDTMDDSYVWYYATAKFQTHPVGQTPQNPFGLHDMLGNVWEWTLDWFAKDYYGKSPQDNPKGPPKGIFKVRRGGSWANFRPYVRCATRYRGKLDHRHHTLGFRVVYKLK